MNRDDIIRMAREAGIEFSLHSKEAEDNFVKHMGRFASLVEQHLLSTDIHSCHANCQRFACVQTRIAVAAEREACAKMAEHIGDKNGLGLYGGIEVDTADAIAAAIRARGEAK